MKEMNWNAMTCNVMIWYVMEWNGNEMKLYEIHEMTLKCNEMGRSDIKRMIMK